MGNVWLALFAEIFFLFVSMYFLGFNIFLKNLLIFFYFVDSVDNKYFLYLLIAFKKKNKKKERKGVFQFNKAWFLETRNYPVVQKYFLDVHKCQVKIWSFPGRFYKIFQYLYLMKAKNYPGQSNNNNFFFIKSWPFSFIFIALRIREIKINIRSYKKVWKTILYRSC